MTKIIATLLVASTVFAHGRIPDAAELKRMAARFARTEYRVDLYDLNSGDRKALVKLIQAARLVDDIYLEQKWSGNHAKWAKLRRDRTELGRARRHYFWISKGPWSELDEHKAFLPGVPDRKLPGANFYPPDATKAEVERWIASLPDSTQRAAKGFYTLLRRNQAGGFTLVPYSQAYRPRLERLAGLLREAAGATTNASLRSFLGLRADALLSNDYYASEVAWMELDSPLDVTIGPYETYNDELLGYKASFEAYVHLRDEAESRKLAFLTGRLQEIEDNLPIDPKYRNPKLGGLAPIVVVNQIIGAGEGNEGVQTAAYNLPNDERVVTEKGSKRTMMKNVQEAKFAKTLVPISRVVLRTEDQPQITFDHFFTHIVAHEVAHGLGPQRITAGGRWSSVRAELKELHSPIEEAKADVTGLFMLQYLMDKGLLDESLGSGEAAERKLYTTYLASAFRTLRFGVKSAHARGMALQFNYFVEKGAYAAHEDGTFTVDIARMKPAVRDLAGELLSVEAEGDYAKAGALLGRYSVIAPSMQAAMDRLEDVPTDIEPVFVTANLMSGRAEEPKSR
ncbi:MAG: dipeptidyl-peptidase 3 family protein [Gemmatimonadales bacterium]